MATPRAHPTRPCGGHLQGHDREGAQFLYIYLSDRPGPKRKGQLIDCWCKEARPLYVTVWGFCSGSFLVIDNEWVWAASPPSFFFFPLNPISIDLIVIREPWTFCC